MDIKRLQSEEAQLAFEAIQSIKESNDGLTLSISYLERFLIKSDNVLIVASEESRPVGFLVAYLLDRVDRNQQMVCLYEIEVIESFRQRGVGTKMIDCLKELCGRIDAMKAWAITNRSNSAAMKLYKQSGAALDGSGDEVVFVYGAGNWKSDMGPS